MSMTEQTGSRGERGEVTVTIEGDAVDGTQTFSIPEQHYKEAVKMARERDISLKSLAIDAFCDGGRSNGEGDRLAAEIRDCMRHSARRAGVDYMEVVAQFCRYGYRHDEEIIGSTAATYPLTGGAKDQG